MLTKCPQCGCLHKATTEDANSPYPSNHCCSKKCLVEYERKSLSVVNENSDEDADCY